jgi:plasmid stabilization system protein ParE
MPRVLFTRAAQADLADAVAWYDTHAPAIVSQFRQAMRSIVTRIENNPRQFSPSPYGTRRALVRRFPYLAIFREATEAVYVVAVFHTSRDPRIWERRAS